MKKINFVIIAILVMTSGICGAVFAQIGPAWVLGIPPPLKQFNSGIKAEDVKCQPNYFPVLIIKIDNGSPACVNPHTANILIERGWGHLP